MTTKDIAVDRNYVGILQLIEKTLTLNIIISVNFAFLT